MKTSRAARGTFVGFPVPWRRTLPWPALAVLAVLSMPMAGAWATAPAHAWRPLILDMTGWEDRTTEADNALPLPAAATGIGTSSQLEIIIDGRPSGCTANFLWSGTNGVTYLGSAGHCFLPAGRTATHGPGADYDAAGVKVRACVEGCYFGGQTGNAVDLIGDNPYVGGVIGGTFVTLGRVAYARQIEGTEKIGHDFGLVEIPSNLSALLRPSMPVWGGPIGSTTVTNGKVLCHYGYGVGVGEAFPTMARLALGSKSPVTSFRMTAASFEGDSGSAVEACSADATGVHGQGAVGILTHLDIRLPPKSPSEHGYIAGTTVAQAIAMATQASLTISLVEGA